jgi:hypothetical protein
MITPDWVAETEDDFYTIAELDQCKEWVGKAAQRVQELMQSSVGVPPVDIIQSAIRVQYWAWGGEDTPQTYRHNHWSNQAARQIHTALLDPDVFLTTECMRCWIRDHYLRTPPNAEIEDADAEIEDDEPYPHWSLQVAERVWEYLRCQKAHPSVDDIRATVQNYLTLVIGVPPDANGFGYSYDHWTARAATEIQVMELRQGSTAERIQQVLLDYKRIADGEVDDMPDPNAEIDADDWAAKAATELMYMIRQRVGDLSAEGIRLLIMDEYEDVNEDAADFDITVPIEHMDLESGPGTTVNIHAPIDVANLTMGPGSTINVFEPIGELALEQGRGGVAVFTATPETSHVQQGSGSVHILANCDECENEVGSC